VPIPASAFQRSGERSGKVTRRGREGVVTVENNLTTGVYLILLELLLVVHCRDGLIEFRFYVPLNTI